MALYKDLKEMKRQNKIRRVFRPGRSRQEVVERNEKYSQIEEVVRKMIEKTLLALEIAEAQKDAFIAAGRPYASLSIMECAAELGYAPDDKYTELSGKHLATRQFLKLDEESQ